MWKLKWYILIMMTCHFPWSWTMRPPYASESTGGEEPTSVSEKPCFKYPRIEAVKNSLDYKPENFYIEHSISERDARIAIKKAKIDSETSTMCETCSEKDIEYCSGVKVITDHCCCDRSDHEIFPYLPHTCYFGDDKCQLEASSCEVYMYLRECCCNNHLIQKWRARFIPSHANVGKRTEWLLILPWILSLIIINTER